MAVDLRQTHFRFGRNTGSESTHDWLANQDTDISFRVDTTFLLRFNIQESGGTAISNVDFQFQYNRNGLGWNNITTTSSVVKAVVNNCFVNAAHCTKRLSGTGTFEASGSGCTTDGLSGGGVNDIAANGCSETECSLQIVSADVSDRDFIHFRITSPDGTITYIVDPTLEVIKETLSFSSALAFLGSALRLLTGIFKTNVSSISFSGSVSGVFSYAFQYLVGTVTYVYQKAEAQARTWEGTLSFTSLITRLTQKLRTKAGAVGLVGTLARLINNLTRSPGGTLTLGGIPSRLINKLTRAYSSALGFSSTVIGLITSTSRSNRADINFTGIILSISIYLYGRLSDAQLSLSGIATRLINNVTRTYEGSVSFSGLLKRLQHFGRLYDGAVGFAGDVIAYLNVTIFYITEDGNLSFSSLINKALSKTREGTITLSAVLNKAFSYLMDWSTLNAAGAISKVSRLGRKCTSSLSFSSLLNKALAATSGSSVSFSGAYSYVKEFIQKSYAETRSGTQSFSGILSRSIQLFKTVQGYIPPIELGERTYSGDISFTGLIYSISIWLYGKLSAATLSFSGVVTYIKSGEIVRTYEGAISPAGVIAFIEVWKFGRLSATLSFAGDVAGVLFETIRYTTVATWNIGSGAISRSVKAARTYSSTLSISGAISRLFSCFESYSGSLSLNSILEYVKTGGAAAISVLEDGWLSFTGQSSRQVQLAMAYSGGTSFSSDFTRRAGFFRELFSGMHPYAPDIGGGSGLTGGEMMMDMTLGL